MPAPEPLAPFLEPLERLGIPYCVEYLKEGGSDKHVRDIRFVLAATVVDRDVLDQEVERLGLGAEWRRCRGDAT